MGLPKRTLVTELTGAGRGAVAAIGLMGPDAWSLVQRCFAPSNPSLPLRQSQVRYGQWHGDRVIDSNRPVCAAESVVITLLDTQLAEVHCHGGRAAVAMILDDSVRHGASLADAKQWLTFQGCSTLEIEAEEVLSRTITQRTAAIAYESASTMRRAVEGWLVSKENTSSWQSIQQEIQVILSRWNVGAHLVDPWHVVFTGPPNVGKSSLLNAILGYRRAITDQVPGTTRDIISADTVLDGWPFRFSDTAGMRSTQHPIERQGIKQALRCVQHADLILRVSDDHALISDHQASPYPSDQRTLRIRNKADLIDQDTRILDRNAGIDIFTVANERPENKGPSGIEQLISKIIQVLIPAIPKSEDPVPLTQRQVDCLQRAYAAPNRQVAELSLKQLLGTQDLN